MALFSPPFASTRLALSASFGAEAAVRLRPGVSLPAFLHAASGLARHYRDASPLGACIGRLTCYNFVLMRYRPGTDLPSAGARLSRVLLAHHCPPGSCLVVSDQRPNDIRDYAGVRDTPLLLSAALTLLAVGTMVHVLVTGVRRRRRDLAVLKALGLVRRQVLGVVEWQAAALAAVALLFGVPLGILAGRWSWAIFAGSAGVSPAATVPVLLVLATIPVTVALGVLIAAWPGRTAARVRPAVALRSE
jgi:hypothetical protein